MKLRHGKYLSLIACTSLCALGNAQFFDDFDRPDNANLGANWTNQSTSVGIANNFAVNTGGGLALATVNGFNVSHMSGVLSVDAIAGQTTGYVALVLGYAGTGLNQALFGKVQDNDGDGDFDSFGLYTGNNVTTGGTFASLTTEFLRGRIYAYMSDADTFTLDVDNNFDTIIDESHSRTGISAFSGSLGTGVGLGMWDSAMANNYNAVPEPATFAALGLGALALMRRRKTKKA